MLSEGKEMQMDTLERVLSGSNFDTVIVMARGEPTVSGNFAEVVKCLGDSRYINVSTNGTFGFEGLRHAFSDGVDSVTVSLDGYDEASYAEIRGDASRFAVVVDNIRSLVGLRSAASSRLAKVTVKTVISSESLAKMEPMIRFAEKLSVDKVIFNNYNPVSSSAGASISYADPATERYLESIVGKDSWDVDISLPRIHAKQGGRSVCRPVLECWSVNPEGARVPCSHNPLRRVVGRHGVTDAGSTVLEELIEALKADDLAALPAPCRYCSHRVEKQHRFRRNRSAWEFA